MPYVFDIDHRHELSLPELTALVGGKAANLAVMTTELGLPVPPGFTISTAACRAYLAGGWPAGLDDELRAHMAGIEARLGRRFGGEQDPLLVSVRSGAPVSMPGMMDTILDLGLTGATTDGFGAANGDPAFAVDCRTRLRTMYRDIVGSEVPDDPWQQLRGAIEAVFRSWNSDRARAYRRHEGIAHDLGTGVTVQAMVFGNRGPRSATGVLFTRNPATGEAAPYGDVMFRAQGEDVVAGTHRTEPIAALESRLPETGRELREYADRLEHHFADMCDIEFTVEEGRLWMLQVRVGKRSPQAALRIALDMADDPDFPLDRAGAVRRVLAVLARPPRVTRRPAHAPTALATGLPASPGVASGELVTEPDAAVAAADAGRTVVLVRSETSPDDVHGMARAAGVLTARGGLASHAAVVARGWGIPAVVGLGGLEVEDGHITIGDTRLETGDVITIDGGTGEVFAGEVAGATTIVPEAATLLAWAVDLGIDVVSDDQERVSEPVPAATTPSASQQVAEAGAPRPEPTRDDILRALLIKGLGTPESLAPMLAVGPDAVTALDPLVGDGLAERAAGGVRLTGEGKLAALGLFAADRARLGEGAADAALDEFLALNDELKACVTAWQVRELDGNQTINDHSDEAYDGEVLERLRGTHGRTAVWLATLAAALPRLATYGDRLNRAVELATAGDGRYVASPRVESYHGIWFELHEELIRLAGRKRSDEAAAGRA